MEDQEAAASNEQTKFQAIVKGPKINGQTTISSLVDSFYNVGYQATNLAKARDEVNRMEGSKIFFGCTSNIISSGLREIIKELCKHKRIAVLVTTAGGIEEDIIKCLLPTYVGTFDLDGAILRNEGLNRIGNLIVPTKNYILFERWLKDLVGDLTKSGPFSTTPSEFIRILGKRINNEDSILYWCYKNEIPVYSPAITDGAIGDILTSYSGPKFVLDIVEDIRSINMECFDIEKEYNGKTSVIIIGCGLIKHHILNANLFKEGCNHCVLLNTANEFDGSDAGATIDESVSWGKIVANNTGVKIHGDATIIFPLLAASSFLLKLDH